MSAKLKYRYTVRFPSYVRISDPKPGSCIRVRSDRHSLKITLSRRVTPGVLAEMFLEYVNTQPDCHGVLTVTDIRVSKVVESVVS